MSSNLATRPGSNIVVDEEAVLKHLGIDARNPAAQALILTCERYGLDPILKHALLIQGRLYVTRDGLLHVAHASKQLDGIEVLEQGADNTHFIAKVAVYRKDMARPFAYVGRYPKNGSNKNYGPEMAVKCAEVMALRRAFDVGIAAKEEVWDQDIETTATSKPVEDASTRKDEGAIAGEAVAERVSTSSAPVEGDVSGREAEDRPSGPGTPSPSASEGGAPAAETQSPEPATSSGPPSDDELNEKDRLVDVVERAIDEHATTLPKVIKASMGYCARVNCTPPASKSGIGKLPLSVLQGIVKELRLDERLVGA